MKQEGVISITSFLLPIMLRKEENYNFKSQVASVGLTVNRKLSIYEQDMEKLGTACF